MSLQDSIFDVAAALEGKPEAGLFEELTAHLGQLERAAEQDRETIRELEAACRVLSRLNNFLLVREALVLLRDVGNAAAGVETETLINEANDRPDFNWKELDRLISNPETFL